MKEHTNISLESELKNKAKKHNICLSNTLADVLKFKIGLIEGNADQISLEMLNVEIEKTQQKSIETGLKLENLLKKRDFLVENIQKTKEKEQQNQKEMIENLSRCLNCKTILHEKEKRHQLKSGILCNSCFFTIEHSKLKEFI